MDVVVCYYNSGFMPTMAKSSAISFNLGELDLEFTTELVGLEDQWLLNRKIEGNLEISRISAENQEGESVKSLSGRGSARRYSQRGWQLHCKQKHDN